ncbi:hypothetical protein A3D09_03715 [Candidatus Collierbacteria bacterium RIFCSPHIGHO2_02_FULL_49_10]|uniref:Uncharacterized protein n=1 Tax=Candidatus Collierbacteria bacterium RIFCSPHIGHO2_02_FULL_49_10 TaxID=1817723 RepID=A0A1F5ETS8_9BACT|nr:MAG: hypothetical protein A3D09_03715 [Candidatus Collierbacteria bacterium RIFCSPHIGHO2_02_FULL_49_10]
MASFSPVSKILSGYQVDEDKQRRISREWQDFAYRLALELDDKAHTSLYMRLCKNTPRPILEEARTFVKGATNAKSKGRLFMWKVKELKTAATEKVAF